MIAAVEKIFLSNKFQANQLEDKDHMNTDVIVYLNNGEKYVASLFTFKKIESQRLEHTQDGNYLKGKYFWEKNMILIDYCDENNIRMLINHLLDEGDFLDVFEKI